MDSSWITEFKSNAIYRIEENVRMVGIALSKIQEDDLWARTNESINPLGNQLLHICGNMTQYAICGLEETKDSRERDAEFSVGGGYTIDELVQQLSRTTQKTIAIIHNTSEAQLLKHYSVQGFDFSGLGLVLHAVEHFSYHTGQIALQVKLRIDKPLGFYEGLDLNILNKDA